MTAAPMIPPSIPPRPPPWPPSPTPPSDVEPIGTLAGSGDGREAMTIDGSAAGASGVDAGAGACEAIEAIGSGAMSVPSGAGCRLAVICS